VFLKYSTLLVIVSELPYNFNLPCLGSTFIFEVYPLPKGKYSFDDVNM
jgi:hypothetical protein